MISDSLKVFMTVADKSNFSKAAKELNLTQPAISFQIQTLEQYYQTILFDRVNRHVKLTEAGELLLEYAQAMSGVQAELERKMQQLTGQVKGKLVIGASRTAGELVMPHLLTSYCRTYPDVDVTLEIHNTYQIKQKILKQYIDIGIVESDVSQEGLFRQPVFSDELLLVVPPDHPWADQASMPIEEFLHEPFLIREPGSGSRLVFEQALMDAGYSVEELHVIMEISSIEATKGAIRSGLGVAILSKWAVMDDVAQGKLKTLRIDDMPMTRPFYIVQNDAAYQTEAASQLIRLIGQCSAEDLGRPQALV